MIKKTKNLPLEDILDKLGIQKKKVVNRTYCVKKIPASKIISYLRSLVKVFVIEKFRRRTKTKLKSHGLKHEFLMPEAWEKMMGEDRIIQIYF